MADSEGCEETWSEMMVRLLKNLQTEMKEELHRWSKELSKELRAIIREESEAMRRDLRDAFEQFREDTRFMDDELLDDDNLDESVTVSEKDLANLPCMQPDVKNMISQPSRLEEKSDKIVEHPDIEENIALFQFGDLIDNGGRGTALEEVCSMFDPTIDIRLYGCHLDSLVEYTSLDIIAHDMFDEMSQRNLGVLSCLLYVMWWRDHFAKKMLDQMLERKCASYAHDDIPILWSYGAGMRIDVASRYDETQQKKHALDWREECALLHMSSILTKELENEPSEVLVNLQTAVKGPVNTLSGSHSGVEIFLSNADVEAAIKHAEDEADYIVLKKMDREEAVDNQEFTEEVVGRLVEDELVNDNNIKPAEEQSCWNSIVSKEDVVALCANNLNEENALTLLVGDEGTDMLADIKQMAAAVASVGQASLSFGNQLRLIDIYAMRFRRLWDPVMDNSAIDFHGHVRSSISNNNSLKDQFPEARSAETNDFGKCFTENRELVSCFENASTLYTTRLERIFDLVNNSTKTEHSEPLLSNVDSLIPSVYVAHIPSNNFEVLNSYERLSNGTPQVELRANVTPSNQGFLNKVLSIQGSVSTSVVSRSSSDHNNGTIHHVVIQSWSSSFLSNDTRSLSNQEARRNSRRLLWNVFSRRSYRRNTEYATIKLPTDDINDISSHGRSSLDIGDNIPEDDSIYWHRRRHDLNRRSWPMRSEIKDRFRGAFEGCNRQSSSCPTGLHPDGACFSDSLMMAGDSNTRASVLRIVMLAETLFEVLNEIHQRRLNTTAGEEIHPIKLSKSFQHWYQVLTKEVVNSISGNQHDLGMWRLVSFRRNNMVSSWKIKGSDNGGKNNVISIDTPSNIKHRMSQDKLAHDSTLGNLLEEDTQLKENLVAHQIHDTPEKKPEEEEAHEHFTYAISTTVLPTERPEDELKEQEHITDAKNSIAPPTEKPAEEEKAQEHLADATNTTSPPVEKPEEIQFKPQGFAEVTNITALPTESPDGEQFKELEDLVEEATNTIAFPILKAEEEEQLQAEDHFFMKLHIPLHHQWKKLEREGLTSPSFNISDFLHFLCQMFMMGCQNMLYMTFNRLPVHLDPLYRRVQLILPQL